MSSEEISFISWPEIVGLHVVRKNLSREGAPIPEGIITYKGKIKLHGNNGGVNISERGDEFVVEAQSRNRVLSATDDLEGFAKWVAVNEAAFVHIRKALKVFPLLLSPFSSPPFSSPPFSPFPIPLPFVHGSEAG
jgi:hypothetical protein